MYVSDCLDHDKVAVHKYVHSILQFVRENYDTIEKVHFFSDDPSSQFKQKYLFSNLEHWEKEFLYKIQWHFFSTSHGKGVVDGIGGSVKGSVHCKILSGRVVHTEKQVAEVAQACHTIVVIKYVSASDITHDKAMLEEWWKNIRTLPGTHKMHSIISTKDGKVKAAEVSTGTLKSKLFLQMLKLQSSQNFNVSSSLQSHSTQLSSPMPVQYQVGQWVIIRYEGKLFPGEITVVKLDQVKVNAMICHRTNLLKWLKKKDHIFYFNHGVVKAIKQPKMQNCRL